MHPISYFVGYGKLSPTYRAFVSNLSSVEVPSSVYEALNKLKWKNVVEDEIRAFNKNGTWKLTDLPSGKQPIGCKWIFHVKYKAYGSIERYKALLVAKGFIQTYGIDYQETFTPVAKLNTVHILLSLVANKEWHLYQLDVKNAFLNGDLEDEVYMEKPPDFERMGNANQVCKL